MTQGHFFEISAPNPLT